MTTVSDQDELFEIPCLSTEQTLAYVFADEVIAALPEWVADKFVRLDKRCADPFVLREIFCGNYLTDPINNAVVLLSTIAAAEHLLWKLETGKPNMAAYANLRDLSDVLKRSIGTTSNIETVQLLNDLLNRIGLIMKRDTASVVASRRSYLLALATRIQKEFSLYHRTDKSYAEYLRTPEWTIARQRKLKQTVYCCQKGGIHSGSIQVHHLNYEHIPDEWDADLIVLCERHHQLAHGREV